MSNSVVFALVVEVVFIFLTVFLLLRPKKSKKVGNALVFITLTFVWSIILGIVLALNNIYFPNYLSINLPF